MEFLLSFSPILPILNCMFLFLFRRWLGPIGTFYSSILTLSLTLILLSYLLVLILNGGGYWFIDFGRWFFCLNWLDSHLIFCVDLLGVLSAILVITLTSLALVFGVEYMYREAFINRLLYLLNLFSTSVFLLFFCYDLFLILLSWECIGLFSLLLVNFYSNRIYTLKAALKTFVLSRLSDLFMFIFFILTVLFFHTTDLSVIFIQVPFFAFHYLFISNLAVHFLTLYSLTLVLSGVIKSAQFLAHVWLPDAMEAPTPASALIHSSTLVVAGIFLILRFAIIFEFSPFTNYFLSILGAITLGFASLVAVFQNDIKKLVAFSTISQIGYLVCGCGFLCHEEVLIYLIIHAINKAFLFILVGYLVHFFAGNTDLRQMGGSFRFSFDIAVLLLGVSLNLCGLPYSAGFIGKEFLIFQFFGDDWVALIVRGSWLLSFFCTPLYMGLLLVISIYGSKKSAFQSYSNFAANSLYSTYYRSPLNEVNRDYYLQRFNFSLGQISYMTNLLTTLILFVFWLLLYWGGEWLLLLSLNYSSPNELSPLHSFSSLSSHVAFNFTLGGGNLALNFNLILFFFIISSLVFLLSLRFDSYIHIFSLALLTEIFIIFFSLISIFGFFLILISFIISFRVAYYILKK